MLVAPAGKKQGMNQVGDNVFNGVGKTQDSFCTFVVFAEYVQETAVLKHRVICLRRRFSSFPFAPYALPLDAPIEEGCDWILDLKPHQCISIWVVVIPCHKLLNRFILINHKS